ncbi:ABC transporter ATP-binding protein [Anaerotruncus sp. 1XD42-93]|jgi:ATP-binding cassette subfamily B protein|uniref:ABC transporter ATP-binding protein n=1 Tax=Anaerotruncus sp. 1XD42-93 TaxID=2320853 RepID=UPI000EA27C51|nr:ABC transporter ATP-binding protein [Anaerotruncus sp. 1XD42-93]MCI9160518.1 ABC transporter ATP-binding protein [Anaerotruncus sp.]MCI9236422.1 ABC transporter ATP-binding protein [Anaerotruncus sp.]NBK17386.1 ABC transporter ATP-binding protein [Anaerotruncus sp. 1XD42-93]RKJ95991.1 ABC transporter ATP-binding protein [Anaerotruncus sp. 1XD22-93]
MKTSVLLRRFAPYFKPYAAIMLIDLVCAALTTVCELVLPLIVRFLTNRGTGGAIGLTVPLILRVGLLYLVLRIVDASANYFMQSIGHVMGARIETDMRRDLFDHLQRLSYTFYDSNKIGQIMARITSDLFDVTEFAHHCPEEFFIAGLKIVVSFAILSNYSLTLTLIIFAIIPLMLLSTIYFNRRMRRAFKKSRNQTGEINAQVEDSLLGVRVVKSFANEELEKEKFDEGNQAFLEIKKEQYRYMAGFNSTTRIYDGVMYLAVMVIGGLFMTYGKITAADFIAYLLYVTTLLASVRRIVEFTEQFQRGMTGIERFIEVIDAPVDIEDAPDASELGQVEGNIRFEQVGFHYADDPAPVLADINLTVKPGESVALVGPSGSGKTTLCNLIPRFYDVTSGRILIDGQDIRSLTLHSLRQQIGVVQQDVYLFAGSVYENIAYGKPGASRQEVIEAAKLAGAHSFISEFPDGYDTYVGERGVRLSGGQKQRISIARVFLKNPPILILDEATSALDNESERIVQQSLEKLAHGRTTFTIAHRLTTIRGADTILVLTEDGIAEQGNHAELMEKRGIYHSLYSMYEESNT